MLSQIILMRIMMKVKMTLEEGQDIKLDLDHHQSDNKVKP